MPDTFAEKHLAFWVDTTAATDYPPMPGDMSVDVAVLGGGITGLTAAVLLKRMGKTVAVIEARRIAEGVTGHTTAKVTAQHGLARLSLLFLAPPSFYNREGPSFNPSPDGPSSSLPGGRLYF